MAKSVAVELCLLILCGAAVALNTIDTFKPIARLSPARSADTDEFGFSVVAHKMSSTATGFTDTLANTVIIVGAPLGRYPGGLDLPLNSSVCQLYDLRRNVPVRDASTLTDEEIRECYIRTGLVYTCPLTGTGGCGPILGNMNATGADGALFDRVGNIRHLNQFGELIIQQDKVDQRMGSTLFSSGEFFVACAPFWQNIGPGQDRETPVGLCAFSGRNLRDFQYTKPCVPIGTGNNGQRSYCMSGHSAAILKGDQLTDSVLGVTTPGRYRYTGGVYYYNNLNTTEEQSTVMSDLHLGLTRHRTTRARVDDSVDLPVTDPFNVPNVDDSQYGFTAVPGRFNGSERFYVSSPRYPNSNTDPIGRVYVVTDERAIPTVAIDGEEFGEYFGYSIATPDLNGDGYDDMVVGAPMYSETNKPELGRIFILYNDAGQSFTKNGTVVGRAREDKQLKGSYGRFGHSVTSLGDLNNDGCDDIAVSAPFDEGGKVFIYYGSKETGINSTVQQTITAEQMTNQVTNLTSSITGFGFSLDGKVDVDDNQYRDLVVSALGTTNTNGQAVFVLRSFPVADVSLNITELPTEIDRGMKSCSVNGENTTCFDFQVCGSFTGRGLPSIAPKFSLQENIIGQQRIYFDPTDIQSSVITAIFNLSNVIQEFCMSFRAYVRNDLMSSQTLDPVSFTFSLVQFERSQSPVDTNFQPDNLEAFPVINSSPVEASVSFVLDCGSDEVCVSDLELLHSNVTYRDNSGFVLVSQESLVVGVVSQVVVDLSYRNLGEPAFQTSLTFSLPDIFINPTVTPRDLFVTCQRGNTPMNDAYNYTCVGFPDPIEMSQMSTDIQLTWQVTSTGLRGDEQPFSIPVSFFITQSTKNRENDTTLSDNDVTVTIPISARASVDILIPQRTVTYLGNRTETQIRSNFRSVDLPYVFNNRGPSTIFSATLDILLPFRVPDQQDQYYLYPFNITFSSSAGAVNCNTAGIINPDNVPSGRRRSIDGYSRSVRQTTPSGVPTILNCSSNPEMCQSLKCQLSNIASTSVSITVTVLVDERTFYNMDQTITLVTTASAMIQDSFIDTSGSTLDTTRNIVISRLTRAPFEFPLYGIILVSVFGAVILLIILILLLYCCGFFRRKSRKNDNDALDQYDSDAFAVAKPQLKDFSSQPSAPESAPAASYDV